MTRELIVVGAGGFGREVLDVVDAVNSVEPEPAWTVAGVADDSPTEANLEHLRKRSVPFLGSTSDLNAVDLGASLHYIVGIGNPAVRRLIADRLDAAGLIPATLIHPTVTMGFDVEIGAGSVLCAGVRLTTHITLGRHVHLNLNSTVGHDTTLGDFVSANPLASISGDCVIEDDALIGVAGVILNGRTVGRGSVIGGCACVVKDVPAGVVVKGIPAR